MSESLFTSTVGTTTAQSRSTSIYEDETVIPGEASTGVSTYTVTDTLTAGGETLTQEFTLFSTFTSSEDDSTSTYTTTSVTTVPGAVSFIVTTGTSTISTSSSTTSSSPTSTSTTTSTSTSSTSSSSSTSTSSTTSSLPTPTRPGPPGLTRSRASTTSDDVVVVTEFTTIQPPSSSSSSTPLSSTSSSGNGGTIADSNAGTSGGSGSSLSTGAIVGIAVGGVAAAILLGLLGWLFCCKGRRGKNKRDSFYAIQNTASSGGDGDRSTDFFNPGYTAPNSPPRGASGAVMSEVAGLGAGAAAAREMSRKQSGRNGVGGRRTSGRAAGGSQYARGMQPDGIDPPLPSGSSGTTAGMAGVGVGMGGAAAGAAAGSGRDGRGGQQPQYGNNGYAPQNQPPMQQSRNAPLPLPLASQYMNHPQYEGNRQVPPSSSRQPPPSAGPVQALRTQNSRASLARSESSKSIPEEMLGKGAGYASPMPPIGPDNKPMTQAQWRERERLRKSGMPAGAAAVAATAAVAGTAGKQDKGKAPAGKGQPSSQPQHQLSQGQRKPLPSPGQPTPSNSNGRLAGQPQPLPQQQPTQTSPQPSRSYRPNEAPAPVPSFNVIPPSLHGSAAPSTRSPPPPAPVSMAQIQPSFPPAQSPPQHLPVAAAPYDRTSPSNSATNLAATKNSANNRSSTSVNSAVQNRHMSQQYPSSPGVPAGANTTDYLLNRQSQQQQPTPQQGAYPAFGSPSYSGLRQFGSSGNLSQNSSAGHQQGRNGHQSLIADDIYGGLVSGLSDRDIHRLSAMGRK